MDDVHTEHATPNSPDSTPDAQRSVPEILNPTPHIRPKLLIVDDDENVRTQMKWAFNEDYEVFLAQDRKTTLELFNKHRPGLVTLDLGLPPDPHGVDEGFALLSEILNSDTLTKVILVTGQTAKEYALGGIARGAYDFVCKPIEVRELEVILRRGFYVHQLEQEHRELQRKLESGPFEGMLGVSPQMQEAFELIRKVATTDVPILIVGESGTGKELAARAIHQESVRRGSPFVVINCGAIPPTLLESELFGHEKGAFTGAHIQRKGRIELAQGGTLLLDEIGELSLELQVKLLRFLQDRRIERVGGRELITVDARIIAATNIDLKQAVSERRFREDLYYRLNVIKIGLPPLRIRGEDIMLLAKVFLDRFGAETGKRSKGFTQEAQQAIRSYSWPGNVRELENRVKRAVIMSDGQRITPGDLELGDPTDYKHASLREARNNFDRNLIQQALARYKGNLTQAAAYLSISRPTLYDLMAKLGVKH